MKLFSILNFRTKYYILYQLQAFKANSYFKKTNLERSKKYAFVFLAADYGNLGDVAITYAQTKFLENRGYDVLEIPISQSLEGLHFVKNNIKPKDIVTTVGGGNMGDLYDQIEYIRQLVFRVFKNNKVISFPQTFDFSETERGKKALEKAKKVYNAHPNLVLVAREQTSYQLMKKHFIGAKVVKTPDIVLSLDKSRPLSNRTGVIFTLRKDKEKDLKIEEQNYIIEQAKKNFKTSKFLDTHIDKQKMEVEVRENELGKIWNSFRQAELVITDRLHGMIFCYITDTPCIAFQNNNHKVRETYDWFEGSNLIDLQTNFSKDLIKEKLENIKIGDGMLNTINLDAAYSPIVMEL